MTLTAVAIGVFVLFKAVVFPFADKMERLERGVRAKEQGLKDIARLSAEYQSYQKGSRGIQQVLAKRPKGFTLFSFLERAAGEAQIKDNIKYMKPSVSSQTSGPYKESMVEMKLEGVTLKQLVDYFYRIESPENVVSIKRLSIKELKKESGYLEAIVQVLTME